MDIKKQITEAVEKITKDDKLQDQFKKDPIKTVEKVVGVDIPDDVVEKIVEGVKGKINVDKVSDALGSLKKMFQILKNKKAVTNLWMLPMYGQAFHDV